MAAKPGKSTDILDAVALLVVDMQGSFLDVIEGAPAVTERCGFAIEAARTLGLRVVFTEQVPGKLGPTEPRLRALVPNARTFSKNTFSALQAEGLLDYLRRNSIYHLLVAGIEVPVCVYQTSLHAVDSDFDVTILSDCVTGRRMDDCLVTLEALTRAHCHVLPAEAVFYSMLGHSGHPLFSAFNSLVKRYAQPGGLDAAPPPPAPREQSAPYERRPALAAPEDRPDLTDPDEVAAGSGEGDRSGDESEPYIGRDADIAPAPADAAADSASDEPPQRRDDSAPRDDAGEESSDGDATEFDADDEEGDEAGGDSRDRPDDGGEGSPHDGGPGGRRRRGRRRRGGARRRRARERAAAAGSGHGHGHGGGHGRSPQHDAPPSEPRHESPAPSAAPAEAAPPPPAPSGDERPPE